VYISEASRCLFLYVSRASASRDARSRRARKEPATRADAGGDSSNGYWYIRIDGKGYLGHRLAWLYMHGHFPDGALDHKNQHRSSCRIADLREATRQNSANSRMQRTNRSGFKGDCWHKKHNKYRARIGFEEKSSSWVSTIRQEKPRAQTTTWRPGYSENLRGRINLSGCWPDRPDSYRPMVAFPCRNLAADRPTSTSHRLANATDQTADRPIIAPGINL
jgi:HNH endonuclease